MTKIADPGVGCRDEVAAELLRPRSEPPASLSWKALVEKRRHVREWWEAPGCQTDMDVKRAIPKPEPLVGLALSGGGIRSATFSLGAIQALARSDRHALLQIDVLSTVSGGGYIGCFLRSLFLPGAARGLAAGDADGTLPGEV